MSESKDILKAACDAAISKLDDDDAIQLQELLVYYSRIQSKPRRALMLSVIQEALYRDMASRQTGNELASGEENFIRDVIRSKDKALRSAA